MKNFKEEFIKKVIGVTCETEEVVSKKYDNMVERLRNIPKEDESRLCTLGVNIKGKNICNVLNDVKERWDEFSNAERIIISNIIAGVRSSNDILSFMEL